MQQVPPLSPSRKPATDDLPIDEIRNLSIGDEAARGRSFDGNADRNRDPSPPKIGKSSGKYNSVASFAPPAAYWPDFPFPSRGSPRLVFFDLETTGFAPTARVIQFGAITVDALTMEIIDRPVTWFVHVSESLAPKITEITGITDAHLKGQPAFADRAEAIHKYMDGAVWCGYNIAKVRFAHKTEVGR